MKAAHNHAPWRRLAGRWAAIVGVAVGGWLVYQAHAANGPAGDAEAETGVLKGNVRVCSDQNASQNNGVKFGVSDCAQNGLLFTNSVKPNTADPGVFAYNGKYYLVSTAGTPSFPISVSSDLVNWTSTGKSVFNGTHPWGMDQFWAPELHRLRDGSFVCVYSARSANNTGAHIGIAYAPDITGPYTDLGKPIVNKSYNSIDGTFLLDDDGKMYLYWKEDDGSTPIWGQQLSDDAKSFVGSPAITIQHGLSWESTSVEGPFPWKHNGAYYMFYSGGIYLSDGYAVGVAKAASPLGPYTKRGDPILKTGNRWRGPGHNSITTVGANDWMVYHAWDTKAGVGNRWGMVDKMTWNSDGWPSVAKGTPTETAQPYPY